MKKRSLALLTIAGSLVSAASAVADTVNYSLISANVTTVAGSIVTFDSSIVAPASNSGGVFILSDSFTCDTGCTIDDTDFGDTPFELTPGMSYLGPLFTANLSTTALGVYQGSFDVSFVDSLGNDFTESAPFSVSISSPSSVTPEPGSWILLSTGLAGILLLRGRRQHVALE